MTFGIVQSILPFDEQGLVNWDIHRKSIAERKAVEKARKMNAGDTTISSPNKFDVLLGRGRPFQEFPGNIRLAVIIDMHRNEHQSANKRGEKTEVCDNIVDIVKDSGARFLKRNENENGWVKVGPIVARDKVGHGFRTKTRRNSQEPEEITKKRTLDLGSSCPHLRIFQPEDNKRRRASSS
jgi:hypothetical protein